MSGGVSEGACERHAASLAAKTSGAKPATSRIPRQTISHCEDSAASTNAFNAMYSGFGNGDRLKRGCKGTANIYMRYRHLTQE